MNALRGQLRISFDLESNGFFRYPEQVCLAQLAIPGHIFLIDSLAIEDMTPLGEILSDERAEIILHSGDHDIRSLDRDWGFRVTSLFDTSIAAAFVGMRRLGLGSVLEASLEIAIAKDKKLQRSDWSLRPLKPKSLHYAADDVRHLIELANTLKNRLTELGRIEWVAEESRRIAAIRYDPPDPDMAVFRVKGSRGLNGQELATLKSLVEFREDEAVKAGRPHFRVIPDAALVTLAANPNSSLKKVAGLGRFARGRLASNLRGAIREGQSSDPVKRPATRRQRSALSKSQLAAVSQRLSRLKKWRAAHAESLDLDPALIWPMTSLKSLATSPDDVDEEMRSPNVRRWQRSEFESSIRQALD